MSAEVIREIDALYLFSITSTLKHPGICYSTVYETVRHAATVFPSLGPSSRSFLGGAAASTVSQTILVPVDIVSQQLMVLSRPISATSSTSSMNERELGRSTKSFNSSASRTQLAQLRSLTPIRLSSVEMVSGWSRFRAVTSQIAKTHGVRGFYRGYLISLSTFVPNSALWWGFYDRFCRESPMERRCDFIRVMRDVLDNIFTISKTLEQGFRRKANDKTIN